MSSTKLSFFFFLVSEWFSKTELRTGGVLQQNWAFFADYFLTPYDFQGFRFRSNRTGKHVENSFALEGIKQKVCKIRKPLISQNKGGCHLEYPLYSTPTQFLKSLRNLTAPYIAPRRDCWRFNYVGRYWRWAVSRNIQGFSLCTLGTAIMAWWWGIVFLLHVCYLGGWGIGFFL